MLAHCILQPVVDLNNIHIIVIIYTGFHSYVIIHIVSHIQIILVNSLVRNWSGRLVYSGWSEFIDCTNCGRITCRGTNIGRNAINIT